MFEGTAAGTTRLVRGGDRVLATLALDAHDERELWPAGGSARYVHRLVVARAAAGCGLGSALLDWAGERASAEGARWLRLDAWAGNADLHAYYLREGFQHVRTIESPAAKRGALFQRRAGAPRNAGLVLTDR